MTWDGFSCILGFQNYSGGGPRTTLQEEIHGRILDFILLSNLCATPPPPSHTDTKTLLFTMIIYDFVIRGFICGL